MLQLQITRKPEDTMKEIKIILVDDQAIVRDGIKAILINEPFIKIVGEASDGVELIEQLKTINPDILIVDNYMPYIKGTDLINILRKKYPGINIIFYSAYLNKESITLAIKAGAKAVIHKHSIKEELVEAIHAVFEGKKYFSEFMLY